MGILYTATLVIFCLLFENTTKAHTFGNRTLGVRQFNHHLTTTQQDTLKNFRLQVAKLLKDDYERTDSYLLGWLLSTKWNVVSAEQMLKASIQWKTVNKVEELGKTKVPAEMLKIFPYRWDGKDKNGCPVVEEDLAKWNISQFILSHEFPRDGVTKFNKLYWQYYDKTEQLLRKDPKKCSQYFFMANLDGLSLKNQIGDLRSIWAFQGMMRSFQKYYPNSMKVAYYFNAPPNFEIILNLFKPFTSDFQLRKTHFFYKGDDSWKEKVLSHVDPKELSPAYGGTKSI